MPLSALLITLAAAVVHAGWNLLLADAEDPRAAAAVAVALGAVLLAPFAALTWRASSAVIPYIVASSALEVLYLAFLATGYALAEMSLVYPIARGSAPVFVLLIGVIALGAGVSALAAGGVALVASGVVLVRGLGGAGRPRDLALAFAVGLSIAGYTLIDSHGIDHAASITYLQLITTPTAVCYLLGTVRLRGAPAVRAALGPRALIAGLGFVGAYGLILVALSQAPAASVAAVRETSVVLAVAFLALRGKEHVDVSRLLGAVAVVAGIACLAAG
jgi:drug/metabolite transporter (DMT)-like permease